MSGSAGTVTFPYYIDPDCNTKTTDENSGAESEGAALEYDPIKDGTVPLISTIDYNVVSGNKATDVGNNILVIEGTGNYKGEAKATWTLVAKEVTITPTSGLSKTYGEADPELTYTTRIDSDTPLKDKFDAVRSGALSYTGTNAGPYHIELGTLAAGSNFELKLDTTPVNFEIKQAEQTITGDDFSARIGSTVDLSEKFNTSGSSSYEITGANTTGSSASGSTLTVGGTAGNFQLKVSAAAATNYKAVEKIVTVKGRFVKEPQKQSFADVPADAYYYGAVEWAAACLAPAGSAPGPRSSPSCGVRPAPPGPRL